MAEGGAVEKKVWTEEERVALAAKLDAGLDDFINCLERKRYAEGWPEDRWQEEMEKHPFFMKQTPKPGEAVHPMFEGLQKLKYDPEENSKEELALNYKEDGNFYMKHKKFRMAVYSFTEAIKAKCENPEVLAVLYNNRSAAQFFLQNYRSSLADAQRAFEFKPKYEKAQWRAAQCAHELQKFELCTELCEQLLEQQVDNEEVRVLLQQNKARKLEVERNERKEAAEAKRRLTKFLRLCDVLNERKVKFDDRKIGQPITEELVRPKFLPLEDYPVRFASDEGDTLVWPGAFSYPEFLFSDFHQQLAEDLTMDECLTSMFLEPLPCDHKQTYYPGTLTVYYENRRVGSVHKVDLNKTLRDIIAEKSFFITGGSLLFYVVPTDSLVEAEFLLQQRHPMIYTYDVCNRF